MDHASGVRTLTFTAMDHDKLRFSIASINYRSLQKMIESVIAGIYSDTVPLSLDGEYFQLQKDGGKLLQEVLREKQEMHDYVTTSLQRGGYYYRKICELFSIYSFVASFPEKNSMVIDSAYMKIVYKDSSLNLFTKPHDAYTRN